MDKKKAMITRYDEIAKRLNIEYISVKRVIDAYIDYCKDELKHGKRISLLGLVYIIPKYEVFDFKVTHAYICKVVADNNGFTYMTVYSIMSEFFANAEQDILNGNVATIRGLATITPLIKNGELSIIHGCISRTLQDELKGIDMPARVHTNKFLRLKLKSQIA